MEREKYFTIIIIVVVVVVVATAVVVVVTSASSIRYPPGLPLKIKMSSLQTLLP